MSQLGESSTLQPLSNGSNGCSRKDDDNEEGDAEKDKGNAEEEEGGYFEGEDIYNSETTARSFAGDKEEDDDEEEDGDGGIRTCEKARRGERRGKNKNKNKNKNKDIVVPESSCSVIALRLLVVLLLLVIACLVTGGTYYFLQSKEEEDYEAATEYFSGAVEGSIRKHSVELYSSFVRLSTLISSDAERSQTSFPFHTIQNVEAMGQWARKQSGMEIVGLAVAVSAAQVPEWNNYSVHHQTWLETSRDIVLSSHEQTVQQSEYITTPNSISPFIYNFKGPNGSPQPVHVSADAAANADATETDNPTMFYPLWHISPPPFDPRTVNMDFGSMEIAQTYFDIVQITRRGQLSSILPPGGPLSALATIGINSAGHDQYHNNLVDYQLDHGPNNSTSSPHMLFIEPVFRKTWHSDSDIVAYLVGYISWDRYVVNLLPEGVEGFLVVIRNTCNQSVTYEIKGKRAVFLGQQLDDSDDTSSFAPPSTAEPLVIVPFVNPDLNTNNATTTMLQPGECAYSFYIYPTATFQESYESNLPLLVTVVVSVAFFILIITFFLFDAFAVHQTLKITMVASAANDIVTSLFPTKVRDRLYEEKKRELENTSESLAAGGGGSASASTHYAAQQSLRQGSIHLQTTTLQQYLAAKRQQNHRSSSNHTRGSLDSETKELLSNAGDLDGDGIMFKTKPIADLYPAATIMFADIVGFTSWSAERGPDQVFTLLETLYRGFDDIAVQKNVFKVETIGDCYIAVAGLPDPRKDHAKVMCRFAHACLEKLYVLLQKLEPTLGPEVTKLDMRFGLHSGKVMAGVLRGKGGRFQLFGDTMNTASRMESTGMKGKIQVSQATADLLSAAGKGHWVVPREEKVDIKGKGEMATYWVQIITTTGQQQGANTATNGTASAAYDDTSNSFSSYKFDKIREVKSSHLSSRSSL